MSDNLLQVDQLRASFFTHVGEVQAVRDVSFSLKKGEILEMCIRDSDDNSTFEDGAPFLVTYGPDNAGTDEDTAGNKAEIVIEPYSDAVNNVYQRISDIKAHVNTRKDVYKRQAQCDRVQRLQAHQIRYLAELRPIRGRQEICQDRQAPRAQV